MRVNFHNLHTLSFAYVIKIFEVLINFAGLKLSNMAVSSIVSCELLINYAQEIDAIIENVQSEDRYLIGDLKFEISESGLGAINDCFHNKVKKSFYLRQLLLDSGMAVTKNGSDECSSSKDGSSSQERGSLRSVENEAKLDLRILINQKRAACSPTIQVTDDVPFRKTEEQNSMVVQHYIESNNGKVTTNLSDQLKDLKISGSELKKTKICLAWKFSQCSIGPKQCHFAHGLHELNRNY